MSTVNTARVSMVVMEAGARWPSWFRGLDGEGANALIQSQADGEQPDQFATRVLQRAGEESGRAQVQLCVLAANGETAPSSLAARSAICRGLVRCMARSGVGELVLTAEADVEDEVRHELLALAGALCEGTNLQVRVRFATREPRSRVRLQAVRPPVVAQAG